MLSISDLHVSGSRNVPLLRGVSLSLEKGELVGLTGPSGAGKTTLIKTVMGMDGSELTVTGGAITLEGKSLLELSDKQRRALCGKTLGFIPQNPMTAFFGNSKIGSQMTETFMLHNDCNKKNALRLAEDALTYVNLTDTKRILGSYPSQLSGGMLQRVVMAIILATKPSYILADEPTGALDRKNRDLLLHLLRDYKNAGVLFISHDTEALRELCGDIYVIQAGEIIEAQPAKQFFQSPQQHWSHSFVQAANHREGGAEAWKELK